MPPYPQHFLVKSISMSEKIKSHIIVCENYEECFYELKERLSPYRVVEFIEEDIKIEHAKAAVAEAYISESETKYVVIAGKSIHPVSQNSLLKVLEEPPKNIEFIIIVPNKSVLLPTIISRMQVVQIKQKREYAALEISMARMDLAQIFEFSKGHDYTKKHEAKTIIENLFYQASTVEQITLNSKQLHAFDQAYRLLDLNANAKVVIVNVLMQFLPKAPRAH